MYTRLAALTAAGIMLASQAFALTDSNRSTQSKADCMQLVDVTKQTAEGNDVGAKAQSEVDRLLAALQGQCDNEQFEQAEQTAALIRGLVATE